MCTPNRLGNYIVVVVIDVVVVDVFVVVFLVVIVITVIVVIVLCLPSRLLFKRSEEG